MKSKDPPKKWIISRLKIFKAVFFFEGFHFEFGSRQSVWAMATSKWKRPSFFLCVALDRMHLALVAATKALLQTRKEIKRVGILAMKS